MIKSKVEILYKYPASELMLGRVAQTCTGYDESFVVPNSEVDHMRSILDHCYKLKHMSVFEFAGAVYRLHIPIFVARQLMRYRASTFMERSLRYCRPIALPAGMVDHETYIYNEACNTYDKLVSEGMKKQDARATLPLCTPTILIWKINCRNLFHVFDERLAPSAQERTREVVQEMKELFSIEFPFLHAVYNKYQNKESK